MHRVTNTTNRNNDQLILLQMKGHIMLLLLGTSTVGPLNGGQKTLKIWKGLPCMS